ncbi:putative lipoprotein [Treponema primitia ZAS-2]|uniref:Putative lipoprotein n=1 Tax=Treponema primitia (strain ATCC BAA-887 / DSM 12427 / ZAS-2) TaxID=545694 RepID=F5YKC9_TREPZ|nr:hypothetical protein [Treponema primitia]AEF83767.1 putative lipoprotein [Treponema primitia ZAS-2]
MKRFLEKGVVLALAFVALISCENPVEAGLGIRVDVNPPLIAIEWPPSGAFIDGDLVFRVSVTDDMQVDHVYVRSGMEADYPNSTWAPIFAPEPGSYIWTWPKRTTDDDDGTFKVRFRAVDTSGKVSETSDLIYKIKNLPPRIDLNRPNFMLKNRSVVGESELAAIRRGLSIPQGDYLTGISTDSKGIRGGFPRIKLWREGTDVPSEWAKMDFYSTEADGATDLNFRWMMRVHPDDPEAPNAEKDVNKWDAYETGVYRMQIWVQDSGDSEPPVETIFPPPFTLDGREYDYLPITITPFVEQVLLSVEMDTRSQDLAYQSQPFSFSATASHSSGIENFKLRVRRAQGDYHELIWRYEDTTGIPGMDINGHETLSASAVSLSVTPGSEYPEKGGGAFNFSSGAYTFLIEAYPSGSQNSPVIWQQKITIDNDPPTVTIPRIDPALVVNYAAPPLDIAFKKDRPLGISEGRVVNGKVIINIKADDPSGLAEQLAEPNNTASKLYRQFRYLLIKTPAFTTEPQAQAYLETILPSVNNTINASAVYNFNKDSITTLNDQNRSHGFISAPAAPLGAAGSSEYWAGFVDDLPYATDDVFKILKSTDSAPDILTINTTIPFPDANSTGELFFFLAAKDKADNLATLAKDGAPIGYHFHVDQQDDKPTVKFTDLNGGINEAEKLAGAFSNILDLNARLRGILEDDDGINLANPGNAKFELYKTGTHAGDEAPGYVPQASDSKTIPHNEQLIGRQDRSINFEFSRADMGRAYGLPALEDGIYRLTITVTDDITKKDGLSAVSNTIGPVFFAIDSANPAITIKTPQNYGYAGRDFPVRIEAFDGNNPLYLEIRPPRAAASTANFNGGALGFNGTTPYYTGNLPGIVQYWDINYINWIKSAPELDWFKGDATSDTSTNKRLAKYGEKRLSEIRADAAAWTKIGGDANGMDNLKKILEQAKLDMVGISGPSDTNPAVTGTCQWDFHLSGVDQDHLTVGILAKDRFLKSTETTLTVKFDQVPPVVESTYPASGAGWFSSNFSIAGSAWDPTRDDQDKEAHPPVIPGANGEIADVKYWIGKKTAVPVTDLNLWAHANLANRNAPRTSWSVYVPVETATEEGEFVLYIAAIDQTGQTSLALNGSVPYFTPALTTNLFANTNIVSIPYGIDKYFPQASGKITGSSDPENVAAYTSYKDILFDLSGTISDTNGLQSYTITQQRNLETPVDITNFSTTLTAGSTSLNWSLSSLPRKTDKTVISPADLQSGAYDGIYTYTITVIDVANQTSTITRTVYLDTQAPTVTVKQQQSSYLDPVIRANFTSERLTFVGEAKDRSPGTVKNVYYWDGPEGVSPTLSYPTLAQVEAQTGLPATWEWKLADGVPGSWRIEINLPNNTPEGKRRIKIIAFDNQGHRSEKLFYTGPGGSETDAETELGVTDPTKRYDFPYALDKTPPAVSGKIFNTPDLAAGTGAFTYYRDLRFDLTGLISDANGLKSFSIIQRKDSGMDSTLTGELTAPLLVPGAGLYNWTLPSLPRKTDKTVISPAELQSGAYDGIYTYTITVIDVADRISSITRTVHVDTQAPEISVITPHTSYVDSTKRAYFSTEHLFLAGEATDRSPGTVKNVYYWDGLASASPAHGDPSLAWIEAQTGAPETWEWKPAQGTPNSWRIDFNLPIGEHEGDRRMKIIAFDNQGHRCEKLLYSGASLGTDAETELGGLDQDKRYDFPYALDRSDPQLTENTIGTENQKLVASEFSLGGRFGDTNKLVSLKIEQEKQLSSNTWDTATIITIPHAPFSGIDELWSTDDLGPGKKLPVDALGNHDPVASGVYQYTITATDIVGRKTRLVRRVKVDVTPPGIKIQFSSYQPDKWYDTTTNIRGDADDSNPDNTAGSGVSGVYYWYGPQTGAGSTPPPYTTLDLLQSNWLSASGTDSWSVPLDISEPGFTEGLYTLWVLPTDVAGNIGGNKPTTPGVPPLSGDPLKYDFKVDKAKPEVEETFIDPDVTAPYTNSPENRSPLRKDFFNLNLNFRDSYMLKSVTVTQSINGGPSLTLANITNLATLSGSLPMSSLPWAAPNTPVATLADGVYTYAVTVSDQAGKTASLIRTITVDREKPKVHIKTPDNDNSQAIGQITIEGEAKDLPYGKVVKVLYWTGLKEDDSSYPAVAIPVPIPVYNPADPIYDPTNTNYNTRPWQEVDGISPGLSSLWFKTIPLGGTAEGKRQVAVIAVDHLGNFSSPELYNPSTNTDHVGIRYFSKDDSQPSFEETVIKGSTESMQKPQFLLKGSAQDSNAIDRVVLKQEWTGTGPSPIPQTITVTLVLNRHPSYKKQTQYWCFNDLPYKDTDTEAHGSSNLSTVSNGGTNSSDPISFTPALADRYTGDGKFRYTLTAYDAAGSVVLLTRNVAIDTTPPRVFLDAGNPLQNSFFDQNAIIRGSAEDTGANKSGVEDIYYWIALRSVTTIPPHAGKNDLTAAANGWQRAEHAVSGGNDTWRLSIDTTVLSPEGEYQLQVLALDYAGNTGGDPGTPASPVQYLFGVDKALPMGDELAMGTDKFTAIAFFLGGTLYDTYGINDYTGVKISQSKDGGTEVLLKAFTDNPGTNYTEYATHGSIPGGRPAETRWWELTGLPRNPGSPATTLLADGKYTYKITFKDKAGKESAITRTISVDNTDPTLSIKPADPDHPNDLAIYAGSVTILGTASDPAPGTVTTVYTWIGADGSSPASTLPLDGIGIVQAGWKLANGTADWNTTYTIGAGKDITTEGKKRLVAYAYDGVGRHSLMKDVRFWVDESAPTVTETAINTNDTKLTNDRFTLEGTAGDTNGVETVEVFQRKVGVSPIDTALPGNLVYKYTGTGVQNVSWAVLSNTSANPGLSLPRNPGSNTAAAYLSPEGYGKEDGVYVYTIIVTDIAGKTTSITRTVNLDSHAPQLGGDGGLSGGVTIASPLVPVNYDSTHASTWLKGTLANISGSSLDYMPTTSGTITPSGVADVYYLVRDGGFSGTLPDVKIATNILSDATQLSLTSVWARANGTAPWSGTINLQVLGEGIKKLYVVAKDGAGNYSAAETRLFGIDMSTPQLTITIPAGKISPQPPASSPDVEYVEDNYFQLSGKIRDQNLLSTPVYMTITQQYTPTGGSIGAVVPLTNITNFVTVQDGIDPKLYTWALPSGYRLPRNPSNIGIEDTLSVDGQYVYVVTLYDAAGNAASLTRKINIDKNGPIVSILSPLQNSNNVGGLLRISGTALDTNPITRVLYYLKKVDGTYNGGVSDDGSRDLDGDGTGYAPAIRAALGGVPPKYDYKLKAAGGYWLETEHMGAAWDSVVDISSFGISEGQLRLWVVASDGGNWSENPKSVDFYLDQNPPLIRTFKGAAIMEDLSFSANVTAAQGANYATADFSFNFDAWDTNKLKAPKLPNGATSSAAVKVERFAGSVATVLADTGTGAPVLIGTSGFTTSPLSDPYDRVHVTVNQKVYDSVSNPTGELHDGTYLYRVTISDTVDKTVVLERTLVVDHTPPEVYVTNITPLVGDNADRVNGVISFNINASDDNGVLGVRYVLLPMGAMQPTSWDDTRFASPPLGAGTAATLGAAPYRGVIDTTTISDNTQYQLCVIARDRAGNVSTNNSAANNRIFTVDQSTDKPVILFTGFDSRPSYAPLPNSYRTIDTKDQGYKLTGVISDDDGIAPNTLQLKYTPDGSTWINVTVDPAKVSQVTPGSSREYAFEYEIPKTGSPGSLADGVYSFSAYVEDDPARKSVNGLDGVAITKPAANNTAYTTFAVDTEVPLLELDAAFISAPNAPPQTYGTQPVITGTLKEPNLASFKVSVDGGIEYSYVPNLELRLGAANGAGVRAWNFTVPFWDTMTQGPHSLMFVAEDNGRKTTPLGYTFYKDTAGPNINFTNINEDNLYIIKTTPEGNTQVLYPDAADYAALPGRADIIADRLAPKLNGSFSDEYSFVFKNGEEQFYYRFDYTGPSTAVGNTGGTGTEPYDWRVSEPSWIGGGGKNVTWQLPLKNRNGTILSQGYHTVDIMVYDSGSNVNGMTLNGFHNGINYSNAFFQYERVAFRIDSEEPDVTIRVPQFNNTVYGDTAADYYFEATVEVSDYTLKDVSATISGMGTAFYHQTYSAGSAGGPINGNFTQKFTKALFATLTGGAPGVYTYTFTVTATDGNGWVGKDERIFTIDASPPKFELNNLVYPTSLIPNPPDYPTTLIENNPRIQGNVSDESGLKLAQYKLQKWDYTLLGGSGDWASTITTTYNTWKELKSGIQGSKLENWEIKLGTDGLGLNDGKYRISFRAEDQALPVANKDESKADIVFFIDSKNPVLRLMNPYDTATALPNRYTKLPLFYSGKEAKNNDASKTYAAFYLVATDENTIVSVRGKMDDNNFSSGTVINGTAPVWTNAQPTVSPTDQVGSQVNYWILLEAFSGASMSQISSGAHTIYVEARDGAGRTTTITREFTFDSEAPVLEINDPYMDKWVESRVIVQGVSSDDNSVADLYYQLGKTETSGNTVWHKYSDSITKPVGATPSKTIFIGSNSINNWKFEFPDILDITKLSDAAAYVTYDTTDQIYELPMRFKVIDKAGNESTRSMVYASSGATGKIAVDIFKLQINPNGDLPVVVINFPLPNDPDYPNGREVGGEASINGLAQDNDWVHSMVYRVKDNLGNLFYTAGGTPGDLDPESNAGDIIGGWRRFTPAITPGAFTAWSFTINRDGSLSPVGDQDKRSFTVEVMAWDASYSDHGTRKQKGLLHSTKVVFVAGQPEYYGDYRVIKDNVSYPLATASTAPNLGGSFTVKARVRDDTGLETITWKKESDSGYTNILASPSTLNPGAPPSWPQYAVPALEHLKRPQEMVNGRWYIIYTQPSSAYSYTTYGAAQNIRGTLFKASFTGTPASSADSWVVEAVSASGTHPAGDLYSGTGKFYVEYEISLTLNADDLISFDIARPYNLSLRVTDLIGTAAILDIPLKLDRYYPWGSMTGNAVAAGTNYRLVGEAWDSDTGITVQGIDKVVVWFSRNNGTADIPMAIKEKAGGIYQAGDTIPVYKGRQVAGGVPNQGGPDSVRLPKLDVPAGSNNVSAIVIDNPAETADDTDGDGFIDGITDNGIHNVWYSYLNTTTFNDGLGKVHFVVFDSAGNASYYEYRLFFSNNPPRVTSVTIATDVLGSSKLPDFSDGREYRAITANYETTNITVRNKRLGFKVHIEGEGAPYHYRLYYVSAYAAATTPATALTAGKYYRIETVADTGWEAVGAPAGFTQGTIFMAIGHAVAGSGTAKELTLTLDRYANINGQDFTIGVGGEQSPFGDSEFSYISDVGNNGAKFILKVYNTIKIPMIPDDHPAYIQIGGVNVYDNAGPYTVWDQPFDIKVIGLNVANTDTVKPKVKLWDFNPAGGAANGTNTAASSGIGDNLGRPGLFNPKGSASNIQRSGHIEPRSGNTSTIDSSLKSYFIEANRPTKFTRDTLSGSVILRGYAFDEQRIGDVSLKFTSSAGTNEFKILEKDTDYTGTNPTRGVLKPVSTGIPGSYDAQANKAYVFNDIDLDGHRAEWAFVWDTESIPANTIVGSDIKVEVIVRDVTNNQNTQRNHPNSGSGGTNDGFSLLTANEGYSRIGVDIQPYIQGYARDASKGYSTIRSKQGWFTFSRGETVTMNGWNLNAPSTTSTIKFYTEGADADVTPGAADQSAHAIKFTVPAAAVTGSIRVAAGGGAQTVNDRNNNLNSWNRGGYNPAEPGGELWNDDHAVHIWQSDDLQTNGNRGYFSQSTRPVDPSMTMDPANGTLWGAWTELSDQGLYYNSNANNTRTTIIAYNGGGTMDHTDIHIPYTKRSSNPGNPANPTVFYNSTRSYAGNFNYYDSGGIKGYDPNGGGRYDSAMSSNITGQYNVELVYHNQIINQFTNPRVVTRGNDIHMTYYDTKDKSMKYWYTKSGMATSSGNYNSGSNPATNYTANSVTLSLRARRWANLDGGYDADDTLGTNRVRQGSLARSVSAGEWSAIDLQNDGKPVVAYYDADHQTVRIAYASVAVNPLAESSQWTVQYAMNASDPNYSFSGQYISMQIDQTNNDAHLAFFKSNSTDLIYLKLAWNGTSYAAGSSIIVDDVGAVGRWVDLSLDQGNRPWISYLDITRTNFYDGVKMAYYDPVKFTGDVADSNGVSQRGWETMAVPARYVITENRTSIETWPGRDTPASNTTTQFWKAAIGYTNSDYYRIAYYVKPKN